MQEVKGFLDGELNYMNLAGDTGPLVYPAGFLYVYSVSNELLLFVYVDTSVSVQAHAHKPSYDWRSLNGRESKTIHFALYLFFCKEVFIEKHK